MAKVEFLVKARHEPGLGPEQVHMGVYLTPALSGHDAVLVFSRSYTPGRDYDETGNWPGRLEQRVLTEFGERLSHVLEQFGDVWASDVRNPSGRED